MRSQLRVPVLGILVTLSLTLLFGVYDAQGNITTNGESAYPLPTVTPSIHNEWITLQESYETQFANLSASPVRGVSGDGWADIIIGQPDFSQITPNEVVANKLFNPGGVYVDRSMQPNRVYVYDGGNSRILGFSSLGTCAGGQNSDQTCTVDSDCPDSSCQIDSARSADIVLGQPNFNSSTCNGDSSFENYPNPPTPTANTLCGLRWEQTSITEGGSMVSMASDSGGNLYVPDFFNNRILRYDDPFTADATADYVWGQSSFSGRECNRGLSTPDASSLCLAPPPGWGMLISGVAIDGKGDLWVADTQNHRVLRFPYSTSLGLPVTTADIVLGQPNFSSNYPGEALNQMHFPSSIRVDSNGTLYVADGFPGTGAEGRVLVFEPPFITGMRASSTLSSGLGDPTGLELAPDGSLWVNDCHNSRFLNYAGGTLQMTITNVPNRVSGGLGVDSDGNVMTTGWDPQQVLRYSSPGFTQDVSFLTADEWGSFNKRGPRGFNGGPLGLEVTAGQLVVGDGARLLFWNALWDLSSNSPADGVIGQPDFYTNPRWDPVFGRMRADQQGNLWVVRGSSAFGWGMFPELHAYTLPLSSDQTPHITIASPIPLKGGGSFTWDWSLILAGIDVQPDCDCLWLSDKENHRVFRIRDVTTSPTVDIILGQLTVSGNQCNQGRGRDNPSRDSLCNPGGLALDNSGNLLVADHNLEFDGNLRLLKWDASLLPPNPASAVFGIPASRVFGRNEDFTEPGCLPGDPMCAPFEPTFDSLGHMAVGFNGYLGPRFPQIYECPLANPLPAKSLFDFHSMPVSARYDSRDNLYILDHNRNRVLIYWNPFDNPRPIVVTIEDGSGPPGTSDNTVLVSADNQSLNDTPIAAGEFRLVYDSSIGLALTDVRTTDRTQGFALSWSLDQSDASSAEAHVLFYSTAGATIPPATGPILQLVFDVDATAEAGTSSSLHFSNFLLSDQLGNTIPVDSSDAGQFLIGCKKDGDINDDGNTNVLDLQILINMILHSPQPDTALYPADWWCRGDLQPQPDGDGQWNVFDLQRLICLILGTCEEGSSQIADTTNRAVQPGGNNVISLGQVHAPAGTNGAFNIDCENVDSISAAELSFTYDSTIGLVIADISTTSRTDGWTVAFSKDDADPMAVEVHILLYNLGGWEIDPGTGGLLSVEYTLAADARGESELRVTQVNLSDRTGAPLGAASQHGTVWVTQSIYLPVVLRNP